MKYSVLSNVISWIFPTRTERKLFRKFCTGIDERILCEKQREIIYRRYPKTVEKLAVYDRFRYESCPYASHVWKDTTKKVKSKIDGVAKDVIEFMQENFDSIIRLLRQITGIVFNDKLIEQMIQHFLSVKGYAYHNAYVMNSAWIFVYMQWRVKFYGMVIFYALMLRIASLQLMTVNMMVLCFII